MVDQVITNQELIDAQKDAQTLEEVVNAAPGTVVTSRLGRSLVSLATIGANTFNTDVILDLTSGKTQKQINDELNSGITAVAAGHKAYKTLADAQAAQASLPANTIVEVTNDATTTNNGTYQWNGTTLTKSVYDPLTQAKLYTDSFDSFRINATKSYPFLRKIRAGYDYGPRQTMLDAVLDIKVHGADPNYYYRIAVIENGNTTLGGNGQGIRIEKALKSTFASTGAATVIHQNTSAVGLNLDYTAGGLQRRVVKCDSDPAYVEIVFDLARLPAYGTAISASNNTSAGYNWIIDPMCYSAENLFPINAAFLEESSIFFNHLKVNLNKDYPCVRAVRLATAPIGTHPYFRQCLLDAQVIGAREGYYYRLSYLQNGADLTSLGVTTKYGISVTRIPKDRLADDYEQNIVTYANTDVQVQPDRVKGGIQTFHLHCPNDPETSIKLVFDVDKMPAEGTAFSALTSNTYGYNAIIDPACYQYNQQPFAFDEGDVLVEYDPDSSQKLMVTYLSGSKWYRIHCARKSINNTFQPLGFSFSPAYTEIGELIPVDKANLVLRTEADSDWHAPVVFTANNNSDLIVTGTAAAMGDIVTITTSVGDPVGSATAGEAGVWYFNVTGMYSLGTVLKATVNGVTSDVAVSLPVPIYTGGAHGTDGGGGTDHTAIQKDLLIFVDDIRIDTSKFLKKKAKKVHCLVSNFVKAGNTYASGRYCLEQNYRYDLSVNGLWIQTEYKALESLTMLADNGCQHYLAGATPETSNTILFWGGNLTARQSINTDVFDSGLKLQYPNVFGVTTRHAVAGDFTSWVDITYGVGNREFLNADRSLYEHPRAGGKTYPRLISEMPLAEGKSYKWRGGYYWGTPRNTDYHDTIQRTQAGDVLVKLDGSYVIV